MTERAFVRYDKQAMELLERAKALALDLEPWPNYFESKTREFRAVSDFIDIGNKSSVLEIGCGNGYTSGLLARISGNVVAFDLPARDPLKHSVGIGAAGEFMRRMDIKNAGVIAGAAESLPFADGSFDLVFSEYMLQYVPDRDRAVAEMRRVLKPGGVMIAVLPNFVARLYAPVMQYGYLINRVLYHAARNIRKFFSVPGPARPDSDTAGNMPVTDKKFLDYILLRPDGAYASFSQELRSHMPWVWKALFARSGMPVERAFSTEVIPLLLFDAIGIRSISLIAGNYNRINKALGGLPIIGECGYSIGIIAHKI